MSVTQKNISKKIALIKKKLAASPKSRVTLILHAKKKQKEKDENAHMAKKEYQKAQVEYFSGTPSPTPPLHL